MGLRYRPVPLAKLLDELHDRLAVRPRVAQQVDVSGAREKITDALEKFDPVNDAWSFIDDDARADARGERLHQHAGGEVRAPPQPAGRLPDRRLGLPAEEQFPDRT